MKHTLRVPTKESYAYIETEFEGTAEDAFAEYQKLTDMVQAKESDFERVVTFTGETVLYNNSSHKYTDLTGKPLLSGSAYKKSLETEFPPTMAGTVAKKYGVSEADIQSMWRMNGFCSSRFGDALHKAMELYRTYAHLAEKLIEKEYFLPKNSTLRKAVLAFPDTSKGVAEIMVSAVALGYVGQVDWLSILGEKHGRIDDYKSDMEVEKNLGGHFNQLSFYAHILRHHGWKIDEVRVWNWDGEEWRSFDSEVLPITTKPM